MQKTLSLPGISLGLHSIAFLPTFSFIRTPSFLPMIYSQGEREVIPAHSKRALPVPTETCLRLHFRREGGAHLPLDLPRCRGAGHHHHGPGHHGHGHGCPGHGHHIHLLCQPSSSPRRCLYHFLRLKITQVGGTFSLFLGFSFITIWDGCYHLLSLYKSASIKTFLL